MPSAVRWRAGPDAPWQEAATRPGLPGIHCAVLATQALPSGGRVELTWQRNDSDERSGVYEVVARAPG